MYEVSKYRNPNTGSTLTIMYDEFAADPREEWDHFGKFTTRGDNRYLPKELDLGLDFEEAEDDGKALDAAGYIWLPVYVYDHSGVAYNTTGFGCPWDSGQVGYIVVSKAEVRRAWGVKRITARIRENVLHGLRGEVAEYGAYRNGEVYYYIIKDLLGEETDRCGGYYGDDGMNAILEDHPEFTEEIA